MELKCCVLLSISSDDFLQLCYLLCPFKSWLQISGNLFSKWWLPSGLMVPYFHKSVSTLKCKYSNLNHKYTLRMNKVMKAKLLVQRLAENMFIMVWNGHLVFWSAENAIPMTLTTHLIVSGVSYPVHVVQMVLRRSSHTNRNHNNYFQVLPHASHCSEYFLWIVPFIVYSYTCTDAEEESYKGMQNTMS